MFDIGGSELLIIGVVALIVVGPKDLPSMFAAVGRFTAKARAMGREFQRAMHDAADETGMAEVRKDIQNLATKKDLGLDKVEEAAQKFESWDPLEDAETKKSKTPTPPSDLALDRAPKKAATRKPAQKVRKSTNKASSASKKHSNPSKTAKAKKS